MKRLLAVLMILCLLPLAASADIYVTLKERIATRSGPGTQYVETASYFTAGTRVLARSKVWDNTNEIWWVQVEFEYQGDKVRVYTGSWRLNIDLQYVAEEVPLDYGTLTTYADCFFGPWYSGFHPWPDTLEAGTGVTIYEVEDGFAHIECWNAWRNQLYRCWVPLSTIDVGYKYQGLNIRGSDGYVPGTVNTATVDVAVLNCRTGAGTGYATVDYVYRGDRIPILDSAYDRNGDLWYQTRVNNRNVWVFASMVRVDGSSYDDEDDRDKGYDHGSGSSLVGQTCVVQASSANARSGPGTDYSIVATVYEWEWYTVLDTAVASNGRTWLKISVNGRTCWISGGVATVNGQFH